MTSTFGVDLKGGDYPLFKHFFLYLLAKQTYIYLDLTMGYSYNTVYIYSSNSLNRHRVHAHEQRAGSFNCLP